MGVSGSGKSTVGAALAGALGCSLVEGDDLHPAANVALMAAGTPLTDLNREPWLRAVRAAIDGHLEAGRPVVVTCSALKRRYRDLLRDPHVVFVHLAGSRALLQARVAARTGHFMPASLLDSQLEALEEPGPDEQAMTVDIALPLAEQVELIVAGLAAGDDVRPE